VTAGGRHLQVVGGLSFTAPKRLVQRCSLEGVRCSRPHGPGPRQMEMDMTGRIPKRAAKLAAALFAASALIAIAAGSASAEVIYDNVPSPLPGNFASLGFAATSTTQFGGEIEVAGTARKNPMVTVVMSSWACQSGSWQANCSSPTSKTFKEPVTVKIYEVGELQNPIATKTKHFKMPYRPSADPTHCSEYPGTWYDEASKECYNGKAFPISFKLKLQRVPKKAIVTFSYPTTSAPAQSLNVSVSEPSEHTLSLGADPTQELFLDSSWSEMYCEGATDVGTFGGSEGNCWDGYQPVIALSAS
jgi:hypothetical protein